jgi:hypothetical protein
MAGPVLPSHAASGKEGKKVPSKNKEHGKKNKVDAADLDSVKHTGKQKRNKHIKIAARPEVEIVEGVISGLASDGIYMDGEFFRIAYSEIKEPSGGELGMKDLFYGLKAHVKFSYGTIEKTTIYGIIKRPALSKEERKKERSKRARAARKKGLVDRSVPKEAIEYMEKLRTEEPGRR